MIDGATDPLRGPAKEGSAALEDRDAAPVEKLPDPKVPTLADKIEEFDGQYRVKLTQFEGPLDLLLHLIQTHELNILDIPVSFITEKYLEYLKLMQALSIEIASEYLVMAATLVHIKSKMLLPTPPAEQDEGMPQDEDIDPRQELVRRLLEYQKYKNAAAELAERGTLGRDVFPRGAEEPVPQGPAPFATVGVFNLLDAFEKILKRTKVRIDHEVVFDRISITERIVELTEKLQGRRAMRFESLFLSGPPPTRFDVVITFLALLEMCRMRLLQVYQTGPLEPIYLGLVEGFSGLPSAEELLRADAEADLAEQETTSDDPHADAPFEVSHPIHTEAEAAPEGPPSGPTPLPDPPEDVLQGETPVPDPPEDPPSGPTPLPDPPEGVLQSETPVPDPPEDVLRSAEAVLEPQEERRESANEDLIDPPEPGGSDD